MVDVDSAVLVAPYLDGRLYHVLRAHAYWRHIDQLVRQNELNVARRIVEIIAHLGTTPISILFHDRVSIRAGETIHLLPDLARAHVFDAETGLRID